MNTEHISNVEISFNKIISLFYVLLVFALVLTYFVFDNVKAMYMIMLFFGGPVVLIDIYHYIWNSINW